MYSLRTQSSTAFFENKALTVVDFFYLKKEEGYDLDLSLVSVASLKNEKKVDHPVICLPFMVIDIFLVIMKEVCNSYAKVTRDVYVSKNDFRKLCSQVAFPLDTSSRLKRFNDSFNMLVNLLNKKRSVSSVAFRKMIKSFIKEEDEVKAQELYQKFRQEFDKIQSFSYNNNLFIKVSDRVVSDISDVLVKKVRTAFVKEFYPVKSDYRLKRAEINEFIFSDIVLKEKEIIEDNTIVNNDSMSSELGNFLDDMVLDFEAKEKALNVEKLQQKIFASFKSNMIYKDININKNTVFYEVHTDASLNTRKAGLGAVVCQVQNSKSKKIIAKMAGMKQLNGEGRFAIQVAELLAISSIVQHMEAMHDENDEVLLHIFSDNLDCVNVLQGVSLWNENSTIKHIVQQIKTSSVRLTYQFVKGHSGNKWNNIAHKLSRLGRRFNEEKFVKV